MCGCRSGCAEGGLIVGEILGKSHRYLSANKKIGLSRPSEHQIETKEMVARNDFQIYLPHSL